MIDLIEMLGSLPAFRDFSRDELATLERALMVTKHDDGHRFTIQGERASSLYVILEGQVEVTRRGPISGRKRRVRMLERGDICGLQSLADLLREETTCTAQGSVLAASFTREVCNLLMAQSASIAFGFQLMVGNQLALDLAERNRTMREQLTEL